MTHKNSKLDANSGFSSHLLSAPLREVLQELGFTQPTPIQAQSLPVLLQGRDLIGQSRTGSGKTAAFSLPILQKLHLAQRRFQALILCPTRELCTQVAREIRRLGRRHPGLQVLALSGGQPIHAQIRSLEKGVHIAVGTPGRIIDHLKRGSLNFRDLKCVVLDEADRMLDMGFQEDMEAILGATPSQRQTIFFSATFPASIEAMSALYQKQPVRVSIESAEPAAQTIEQKFYETSHENKMSALQGILQKFQPESAIIFCNQKVTVSDVTTSLIHAGASAACIHGDLEQYDRDRVMAKLRNRSLRILIATDVAARGLDIPDLDLVVNFDLPSKPDTYVHRIGRTGRAGKSGVAISLATSRESFKIKTIEEALACKFEKQLWPEGKAANKINLAPFKDAEMTTLCIFGGRKDKLRPGDILGALTGESGGLQAGDIGKFEIHDRFSYIAIAKSMAHQALQSLRHGHIKKKKFNVELVP